MNVNLIMLSGWFLEEVCEINDYEDFNYYEVFDCDGVNFVVSEEKISVSD